VYTIRPVNYEHTEIDPLNFYDLDTGSEDVMIEYHNYRTRIFQDTRSLQQPKGFVFSQLIQDGFLSRPDVVVFVDDQLVNLESMQSHCDYLGISYVGLLCGAYTN
jgi:hypothetical protein